MLEEGLARLSGIARRDLGTDPSRVPGAGAAGGLGWGLMAFCGAELVSGFRLVSETLGLERLVRDSDWVVTGEGRTDSTSLQGKVVGGVLEMCRRVRRRCVILCGAVGGDAGGLFDAGATAVLSVSQGPASLEESMRSAGRLLEDAAYNLGRLIAAAQREQEVQ